jgi:hypothetical protein
MKTMVAPLCALLLSGSAVAATAAPGAQPPIRMQHPEMRELPLRSGSGDGVRTAEEMRSGSAWGTHGGMSGDYQGVGGPDEGEEEPRAYRPCRSRSDDRCQQRR